ncbi:MAG: site-specific integrase [Bryobacteraceae bacterium]|nr:site-specific integrase [Bryobacteraceae bacterium]
MLQQHTEAGSLYTHGGLRKYLTRRERSDFIEVATSWPRQDVATLCLILAHTGCRISEALGVTAASVERSEQFLALRSLKRRNGTVVIREVPIPQSLLAALDRHHDLGDRGQLLWSICRSQAWRLVKEVMREADVPPGPHATPRGLRHGFGLHAVRCGVPLNLVQRWLGHASLKTTAIYLQAMGDEELEIASRMWVT